MAKPALSERPHYTSDLNHRQAVNTYLSKHGREARALRAQEREVAAALVDALYYCPGLPYGHAGYHDQAQMRAAMQHPNDVVLSCGVSYNEILRTKKEEEAAQARLQKQWNESIFCEVMEDQHYMDLLFRPASYCGECGEEVDSLDLVCVDCPAV